MTDSKKIEILIDQVDRMSESITKFRLGMESRDLEAVCDRQKRHIDRLISIVETLIQSQ